jgi:hypothetical protein
MRTKARCWRCCSIRSSSRYARSAARVKPKWWKPGSCRTPCSRRSHACDRHGQRRDEAHSQSLVRDQAVDRSLRATRCGPGRARTSRSEHRLAGMADRTASATPSHSTQLGSAQATARARGARVRGTNYAGARPREHDRRRDPAAARHSTRSRRGCAPHARRAGELPNLKNEAR